MEYMDVPYLPYVLLVLQTSKTLVTAKYQEIIIFDILGMARVCVIGAGAAGLCAARHLLVEPCVGSVDVLEQAGQLGGTWVYTEDVGYDDFGLPIHTSMYKSLR